MRRDTGISLYEVNLVAFLVLWFTQRIGFLDLITPVWMVGGYNIGFETIRGLLYVLLLFIMWYLNANFAPPQWIRGIRSHQGVARHFDAFIALLCLGLMAAAANMNLLGSSGRYLWFLALFTFMAALVSFFTGWERTRTAEEIDADVIIQEIRADGPQEPLEEQETT